MTRRTKIIIAVVIVLAIAVALALWLSLRTSPPPVAGPTTNQPVQTGGSGLPSVNAPPQAAANVNSARAATAPASAPVDDRSNVRRVAAAFAERFGSFSNQSDFENVTDLKPLMTAAMQAWADQYVVEQRAARGSTSGQPYFGVTTRAIATQLPAFDDPGGKASVLVKTQRNESSSSGSRVYYQDLVLEFVREGAIWKVDSAVWQTSG